MYTLILWQNYKLCHRKRWRKVEERCFYNRHRWSFLRIRTKIIKIIFDLQMGPRGKIESSRQSWNKSRIRSGPRLSSRAEFLVISSGLRSILSSNLRSNSRKISGLSRGQQKTLRACETRSQCVCLTPPRAPLKVSFLHSIVFHML